MSLCLQRDPAQRPTARELLRHRFIKNAKRTSVLIDLIDRLARWRSDGGDRQDHAEDDGDEDDTEEGVDDLWDFGTVKNGRNHGTLSTSRLGTLARQHAMQANSSSNNGDTFVTPDSTPQKTHPRNLEVGSHFGSRTSNSSSGGSSGGGTVRQAVHPRPSIRNLAGDGDNNSSRQATRLDSSSNVMGMDVASENLSQSVASALNGSSMSGIQQNHSQYKGGNLHTTSPNGIDDKGYQQSDQFINPGSTFVSSQANRIEQLHLNSNETQHGQQGRQGTVGRRGGSLRGIAEKRSEDTYTGLPTTEGDDVAEEQSLTALDTVILPVLEQLSLVVSQHHQQQQQQRSNQSKDPASKRDQDQDQDGDFEGEAAQLSIQRLCAALVDCERTTRGFSNAFAIEIFHAMNFTDAEADLVEEHQ